MSLQKFSADLRVEVQFDVDDDLAAKDFGSMEEYRAAYAPNLQVEIESHLSGLGWNVLDYDVKVTVL